MQIKWLWFLLWSTLLLACQQGEEKQESKDPVLEKIAGKDYAEMIQIPTTPDGKIDTSQTAKFTLEKKVFDFDTIYQGDKVAHDFIFTNTGKQDLYLLQTNSSCGCTVSQYSKEALAPGEKGSIRIAFDSSGKSGKQDRKVTIITNAFPSENIIRMTGYVKQLNE
jgi:hypothetical protein